MPVEGVCLERHLPVERHHTTVGCDYQWVDLDEVRVEFNGGFGESIEEPQTVLERITFETKCVCDVSRLEGKQAERRIDLLFEDLVGSLFRHHFDFGPALGRCHHDVARGRPVEQHRQIQLGGDVDPLLDVETVDLFALFTGLDRHERRAEHLARQLADALLGGADAPVDPVGDDVHTSDIGILLETPLPTPTGVDL